MSHVKIEIDTRSFEHTVKTWARKDWPEMMAQAFGELAYMGSKGVDKLARVKFDLQSEYVPDSIKSMPRTKSQMQAAARSIRSHHDMMAMTYVRGASTPKRDMGFMADHVEGSNRMPKTGTAIAVPLDGLKQYSYRTPRGAVRKRWKPEELLKRYNQVHSRLVGNTTTNRGLKLGPQRHRAPGNAFLIKGPAGIPIIARRELSHPLPLQSLYALVPEADINKRWDFHGEVWDQVRHSYVAILSRAVAKLPNYGKR